MTRKALSPVWSVVLLLGGCPKRQTTPRIVYIPAPPAATTKTQPETSQTLVIEEPAPPVPPEATPSQAEPAPQETTPLRRRRSRPETPPPTEAPPEQAPVPTLEPSQSPAQAVELRSRVIGLQHQLQQQIEKLNRAGLSGAELRTLGGARAFLAQSIRALGDSDLQRALNLAQKAQLLVQAIVGSQ